MSSHAQRTAPRPRVESPAPGRRSPPGGGARPAAVIGRAPLTAPLRGEHGPLPFGEVAYEVVGRGGGPAIAVLGGISATRHLCSNSADASPGWWEAQVGPARAVDTRRFRAVGMDFLGAELPAGDPVPLVGTGDQAGALAAALDAEGIGRLHAIVGSSYGGMVALAFAARFPERVARVVVISAAHEPHPMATAVRALQRRIVRDGLARGRGREALGLARALAMTTYRTDREFAARFGSCWSSANGAARFPVEGYLDHCARRYVEACTPARFLCLSQSIDLHRVDPREVTVPVVLVTVTGDPIAPPWQVADLAERLPGKSLLHTIESIYGHDAFLKEVERIASILSHALEDEA